MIVRIEFFNLCKIVNGIMIIIGTGKLSRIQSAAESVNINMSREDWYRIWTAAKGYEVP